MNTSKDRGTMIHGHSANYFGDKTGKTGRTEEQLLHIGFSQKAIDEIIKPGLEKLGRRLPDQPPPLAVSGKFGVPVWDEKTEQNAAKFVDALPAGKVGAQYVALLIAEGGYRPYYFTPIETPLGLELTLAGVLKGTPVKEGENPLRFTVTDSLERKVEGSLVLSVSPADTVDAPEESEVEAEESEAPSPFAPLLEIATHEFQAGAVNLGNTVIEPPAAPVAKIQPGAPAVPVVTENQGGENKADLSAGDAGNPPAPAATPEPGATGLETPPSGTTDAGAPAVNPEIEPKNGGAKSRK